MGQHDTQQSAGCFIGLCVPIVNKIKGEKEEAVLRRAKEGVIVEQRGGVGGSRGEECCSVIDFRVVVLQCYCCDADLIKGETAH